MNRSKSFAKFFKVFTLSYWKDYFHKVKKAKNHTMDPNNAFEVQNVNAFFADLNSAPNYVVKNVSYNFEKNKIYSIIGNSGSGKSTLIMHFNGLLKSKTANIFFDQKNKILFYKHKVKNFKSLRRKVSMVFQFPEYQLFKETVLKDVSYGPKVLKIKKDEIIPRSVKQLLKLGMDENFFNSNPFSLSGGQKRRVALAGILAIDPDIYIFDEPTVGLDPSTEKEIIDLILDLKKHNKTVVVISHNMDHVLEISDEVLLLNEGRLVQHDAPYNLFINNQLLEKLKIDKPKVIETIEYLIDQDKSFEKLLDYQPRTVKELAISIKKVVEIQGENYGS